MLILFITVAWVIIYVLNKKVSYYKQKEQEEIDKVKKMLEFYNALVRWVELEQGKKRFSVYFKNNGYETIGIYGMKELGVLLYKGLMMENQQVECFIDKDLSVSDGSFSVILPNENIPKVDVIIVTAIHYYDSIYTELRKYTDADIVSIEDVLWGI